MADSGHTAPVPPADSGSSDEGADAEMPTMHLDAVTTDPRMHIRLFGSTAFFRLWLTQVVSATGDWLGFLAIAALATRVSETSPEAAVGFVMAARIVPGFFLGPAAGLFADRFDRKRLMVICDVGRALVLASLPFVDTVIGLFFASLVLEVFTLLWAPAKEASVPNLVPTEHLTTANSLSLAAAYGTIPLAAGMFALLAKFSEQLGDFELFIFVRGTQEGLAFYVDALTFLLSAAMIWSLPIPGRSRAEMKKAASRKGLDLGGAFTELKEGWQFVFVNPVARAVNLGLATGLIGGGMLVPLGPVFADEVLGAGQAGFGILIFSLGCGVAGGVIALSLVQNRVTKEWVFCGAVFVAGISLIAAASMSTLGSSAVFVAALGVSAGTVYVLGFTLLHEHVEDELRGRIFSALYTLVRLCVLVAFAVGPFLSEVLGRVSESLFESSLSIGGIAIAVPGVRITLWLAGVIIFAAGFIATASMRDALRQELVQPRRTGETPVVPPTAADTADSSEPTDL